MLSSSAEDSLEVTESLIKDLNELNVILERKYNLICLFTEQLKKQFIKEKDSIYFVVKNV